MIKVSKKIVKIYDNFHVILSFFYIYRNYENRVKNTPCLRSRHRGKTGLKFERFSPRFLRCLRPSPLSASVSGVGWGLWDSSLRSE